MSSERQLLETDNPWWGEHVHRYNEVVQYIASNDTILDLACGSGFGTDILSQHTGNIVTGGDIVFNVIQECKNNWNRKNLQFEVLDGTKLPYNDSYFDKIVSFETIEHTREYYKMLNEFNRVLKPGGMGFISTPNFLINSPSGKITNPYHTQEFTYEELKKILSDVFSEIGIKGQKYSRYDNKEVSRVGKFIEWLFAIKGVRKIPFHFKNHVSKYITGKQFFPSQEDYKMVDNSEAVLKCKTFFCICRKKLL